MRIQSSISVFVMARCFILGVSLQFMNTAIEENRRSFANLADSNEIEQSAPDTVREKTSVFIWVARFKSHC